MCVTDPGGADRTGKRHTRDRERGRCTDQRRDVGIDVRVQRHDRCDDLHLVFKTFRKQRPDRTVDQAGGQGFLFAGSPLAFEKPARDLTGRVGFFLVVDRQREKVPAGFRGFATDGGDQHDGLGHVDDDGAVCLARDTTRFQGDEVFPILERLSY